MKPSKPFPNGSTAEWWKENFCERCNKYKTDGFGSILPDNCKIEELIGMSYFDSAHWPSESIVETSRCAWVCTEFETDDERLMESYSGFFRGAK